MKPETKKFKLKPEQQQQQKQQKQVQISSFLDQIIIAALSHREMPQPTTFLVKFDLFYVSVPNSFVCKRGH